MLVFIAVLIGIGLPLYAVYLAWSSRSGGRLFWIMRTVAALAVMGFLTLVARWDLLSSHLVYVWWAIVIVAALLGLIAMRGRRWIETERPRALAWAALDPIIGIALFGYAATGLLHPAAVELSPPLAGGNFVAVQAGNNPLINYHNTYAPQRFALDIVELDPLGRRAEAIEPPSLEAYHVYGTPVVSPCAGEVVDAVNGIPETAIGEANREQPAGNHVIIRCQGVDITLAHLRPDTLTVTAGDAVEVGQQLAEVGNSGNTTEPHLHIHAVPEGTASEAQGVPLTFNGAFLVRNSTFRS